MTLSFVSRLPRMRGTKVVRYRTVGAAVGRVKPPCVDVEHVPWVVGLALLVAASTEPRTQALDAGAYLVPIARLIVMSSSSYPSAA